MEWVRRMEAWNRSGAHPRFVLNGPDLTLTCVAGNGGVRSSGILPKGPGTIPGLRAQRQTGRVNVIESLLMFR